MYSFYSYCWSNFANITNSSLTHKCKYKIPEKVIEILFFYLLNFYAADVTDTWKLLRYFFLTSALMIQLFKDTYAKHMFFSNTAYIFYFCALFFWTVFFQFSPLQTSECFSKVFDHEMWMQVDFIQCYSPWNDRSYSDKSHKPIILKMHKGFF